MNLKKLVLCLVACVCLNATSREQSSPDSLAVANIKLSARIEAYIVERRTPGMVVMIVKDRKVMLHEAYGYSDLERRQPLHRDDIFRFYSMSKPITAAAIMKLIEQGKLRPDTPLDAIWPEFSGRASITISQLLTHTAGFPYGGNWKSLTGWRYWLSDPLNDNNTLPQMASKLASLPTVREPGTAWVYGMSSDLLGAVIEKVSGEPLPQFLQNTLFRPLAMRDTAFFVNTLESDRLVPYYTYDTDNKVAKRSDDGTRFRRAPTLASGGGGLVGNASDYMRFIQMLLYPDAYSHVLSPALTRAITTNQLPPAIPTIPRKLYPNSGFGFGLGVKLSDEQHLKKGSIYWAGKGGTVFWADPKQGLAVVVLMQLEDERPELEKRLVPWVDEWLRRQSSQTDASSGERSHFKSRTAIGAYRCAGGGQMQPSGWIETALESCDL